MSDIINALTSLRNSLYVIESYIITCADFKVYIQQVDNELATVDGGGDGVSLLQRVRRLKEKNEDFRRQLQRSNAKRPRRRTAPKRAVKPASRR